MRLRAILVPLLLLSAISAVAAPQANAPRDPRLIDAQSFQQIVQRYHGKPLLVNFWATWCEPCRDEYPLLNEFARQYATQGLHVVGINFDQDGDLILMRRFIARYRPVFPNYRKKPGNESAFQEAVLPGWNGSLPVSIFYSKDGQQIGHIIGAGNRDTFEAAIRTLLSADSASGPPLPSQ